MRVRKHVEAREHPLVCLFIIDSIIRQVGLQCIVGYNIPYHDYAYNPRNPEDPENLLNFHRGQTGTY